MAEQDITKTGPVGLPGMKGLNQKEEISSSDADAAVEMLRRGMSDFTPRNYGITSQSYDYDDTVKNGYGSSKYDPGFIKPYQLENLEDTRAQNQSGFAKLFNGTVKGITTAGTTFLNGTAGLLVGLGTGVYNMFDNDETTSFGSGIWNNAFNNLMNKANEKMEEILPNYYTNDEREHPLQHIFNANFIGDKFIKNFGFTVGALGSSVALGGVYGSLGHVIGKTALGLGTAGKAAVGISKAVTMGSGAVAAAVAEGSIEALQTANQMGKENEELYKQQRDYNIDKIMNNEDLTDYEKEILIADENRKYGEAMVKLTEDRTKAGNLDLLLNIPILTLSNVIQFNKLLSNGYRSSKRIANVFGKAGNFKAGDLLDRSKAGRAVKALAKSGLAEGNEEVQQQIASDVSNNLYSLKLNDYYKSTIDPDSNAQTTDYIKATAAQILNTLGREDTWEQFIIGSLTGLLGMPVFGKSNTTEKADLGKGKSVGISGGFFGQLNEINEDYQRSKNVANYLNKKMADPEFKNYYQGLVRHEYFQKKMDAALDASLEKEYKDSEFAQLYGDVMMFMAAGKKDVLVDMIKDASSNLSDEEVAEILKYTTSEEVLKDGSKVKVGAFIKDGNPLSADEIRTKIQKNAEDMLSAIDRIEDEYDNLDYRTKGRLSNDQLQQLTYMKMQTDNWMQRTKEVSKESKEFFNKIKENITTRLDNYKKQLEIDPEDSDIKRQIKALEGNLKTIDSFINELARTESLEKVGLGDHVKSRVNYGTILRAVDSKYIRSLSTPDEIEDMKQKLKDLESMSYSMELFSKKLSDYMNNPDHLTADNAEVIKSMREADEIERASRASQDLAKAKNIEEFDKKLKSTLDPTAYNKAVDDLIAAKNPLAQQYKINNQVAEEQIKELEDIVANKKSVPPIGKGRKFKVSKELADKVKQVIGFRRKYTDPAVGENGQMSSYDEISNPYLDVFDDIVEDKTGWERIFGITDPNEIQQIKDVFAHITKTVNEDRLKSGLLDDRKLYGYPEKTPTTPPIVTGKDGTVTVTPATPPQAPTPSTPVDTKESPAVKEVTPEDLKAQKEEAERREGEAAKRKIAEENKAGQRDYWKSNMPEYGVKERASGLISAPLTSDGKSPLILNGVVKKLKGYEFINSGQLTKGTKIKFVIDPSLLGDTLNSVTEEGLKEQLRRTIFIVTESGQVIGTLQDSDYLIAKYEGLAEFIDYMRNGFEKSGTKEFFDSGVVTEIQDLIPGFVPYTEEEISLKDSTAGMSPIFEVGTTKLDNGEEQKKLKIKISSPFGDREFNPDVRIAHFTSEMIKDIELRDETTGEIDVILAPFKKTPLYKHMRDSITAAVTKIMDAHTKDTEHGTRISSDEALELRKAIQEFLYTYTGLDKHLHVDVNKDGGQISFRVGDQVRYAKMFTLGSAPATITLDSEASTDTKTQRVTSHRNTENIVNDIIEYLAEFGLPFQVDFSRIDDSNYMKERIDSNVLYTNIKEARLYDNWFTMKPVKKKDGKWTNGTIEQEVKEVSAIREAVAGAVAGAEKEGAQTPVEVPKPEPQETKRPEPKPEKKPQGGKKEILFRFRTRKEWVNYNKEKEMEWLDNALPQMSNEDRVQFVKGLIDVADRGAKAWGMLDRGVMVLSDVAAEGTVYHEAFHVVFNMILSPQERTALYNSAKRVWPLASGELDLEEKMAEEFRRYVMHQQNNTKPKDLGTRIGRLFKSLWTKVKNWYSPTMYSYFAKINEGYYSTSPLNDMYGTKYREYNLRDKQEAEAYRRLSEIWNDKQGRPTYYEVNGVKIPVQIVRRGKTGMELRFSTMKEAVMFQDFWRKEAMATFSPIRFIEKIGKYRVYMHKPGIMSEKSIRELQEDLEYNDITSISEFDKLADYEKSELTARGYTKEDFDNLSDIEQQAIRECFFTM